MLELMDPVKINHVELMLKKYCVSEPSLVLGYLTELFFFWTGLQTLSSNLLLGQNFQQARP